MATGISQVLCRGELKAVSGKRDVLQICQFARNTSIAVAIPDRSWCRRAAPRGRRFVIASESAKKGKRPRPHEEFLSTSRMK